MLFLLASCNHIFIFLIEPYNSLSDLSVNPRFFHFVGVKTLEIAIQTWQTSLEHNCVYV